MKMAKETWIQSQCQEVEAGLRKNNSKKAYQLVKDLTTEKQGKTTTIQNKSGKCLTVTHKSTVARTVMCRQDGRGRFPVLLDDHSKCRTNSQRKSQLS